MANTVPDPPSTPSQQSREVGYRFALLITGSPEAAAAVVRAALVESAEEWAGLRSRERRRALLLRRIVAAARKWREANPAESAREVVYGRVAALPERARNALALFLCMEPETAVGDMADLLRVKHSAFVKALDEARRGLAPGIVLPENLLLREHRPWGGNSPKAAKAVAAAGDAAELAAQAEADAGLYAEVGFLEVPAEILELIVAAPARSRLRLIFQPVVLAIVLATLVVLGTVIYIARTRMGDFPGKDTVDEFVEHAGTTVEYEPFTTGPAGDLDDWFLLKGFGGFDVPEQLEQAKAVGGRTFRYNGLPVAEVELEAKNARLFVFRVAELKTTPFEPGRGWRFFQHDDWAVGVTRDDENGYILLYEGDSESGPAFLKAAGKE